MKQAKLVLFVLVSLFILIGCEGEDGNDGRNGRDGEGCVVEQGDAGANTVTCADGRSITLRDGADGEKGEQGEKGETGKEGPQGLPGADGANGESCALEEEDGITSVVCGEENFPLPTANEDACTAEQSEDESWTIVCGENRIEVPTQSSPAEIIQQALTPVTAPEVTIAAGKDGVWAELKFEIDVAIDEEASEGAFGEGYKIEKTDTKTYVISSDDEELFKAFPFSNELATWSYEIPADLFSNALNPALVFEDSITLSIDQFSYVLDLETLSFDKDDSTVCVEGFTPASFEDAKASEAPYPILLSLVDKKAYDTSKEVVVTLNPTDRLTVICRR